MDTPGYRTFGNVVTDLMVIMGYDKSQYFYLTQLCLNACREIHRFYTGNNKTQKIPVNIDLNSIDWPDDYEGFVSLSIPVGGRMVPLTRQDAIVTTTTVINGQETLDPTAGEGLPVGGPRRHGLGASGGRNKFYYTIDERNRRFFINGHNPLSAVLSYTSSGVEDEDSLIPNKFIPAIQYYASWKINERADSGDPRALNKAQYFETQFEKEATKITVAESPTLDEIYDAIYKSMTGTYSR
jgi:hypothetical protein